MSENLYNWFRLRLLGTSRRLSLYGQWQPLLDDLGLASELAYLDRARAHDRDTQALEIRWRTRESRGQYGPEALAIDAVLDSILVGIHEMAVGQTRGLGDEAPLVQAAERVLRSAFPLGVKAVVSAPFVEQAAEVERILTRFRGPLQADVTALHLDGMVARLASTAVTFRQAIDAGNQRLSFDQVQRARQRGLAYVADLLVRVLAHFADSDDPDHVATRTLFLAPLAAHDQQLRGEAASRRRPANDESPEVADDPAPEAAGDPAPEAAGDPAPEEVAARASDATAHEAVLAPRPRGVRSGESPPDQQQAQADQQEHGQARAAAGLTPSAAAGRL